MKFTYPAVIHKNEDGTYKGYFPDLEGTEIEAPTYDDILNLAIETAREWITVELEEDNLDLPAVSDHSDLKLEEGDELHDIAVIIRLYDGWDE
ncbi:MAG: type II toxin-antitoxin system HicB family antitoxin [Lachnospiraceae bacterium]|nr:type II toxin-antitoxin system HicB family antitoxin [Lachnospiraceae bacterium]